jgi:hypothetical protein
MRMVGEPPKLPPPSARDRIRIKRTMTTPAQSAAHLATPFAAGLRCRRAGESRAAGMPARRGKASPDHGLPKKEPILERRADAQPLDVLGTLVARGGRWVSRKTVKNHVKHAGTAANLALLRVENKGRPPGHTAMRTRATIQPTGNRSRCPSAPTSNPS